MAAIAAKDGHTSTIAPPDMPPPTDPTLDVTVKWLPKPVPNKDAEAKDQAGMKPYTEPLVNTDVTFEMAPIPGGVYQDGQPGGRKGVARPTKGRKSKSKIEPFWMGRHEVTWDEYELWGLGLDQQRREMTKVSADRVGQVGRRPGHSHQALCRHDLRHGQARAIRRSA